MRAILVSETLPIAVSILALVVAALSYWKSAATKRREWRIRIAILCDELVRRLDEIELHASRLSFDAKQQLEQKDPFTYLFEGIPERATDVAAKARDTRHSVVMLTHKYRWKFDQRLEEILVGLEGRRLETVFLEETLQTMFRQVQAR